MQQKKSCEEASIKERSLWQNLNFRIYFSKITTNSSLKYSQRDKKKSLNFMKLSLVQLKIHSNNTKWKFKDWKSKVLAWRKKWKMFRFMILKMSKWIHNNKLNALIWNKKSKVLSRVSLGKQRKIRMWSNTAIKCLWNTIETSWYWQTKYCRQRMTIKLPISISCLSSLKQNSQGKF